MEMYFAYKGKWFSITQEECSGLAKHPKMSMKNFDSNCEKISNFFNMGVIDFSLKVIPRKFRHNELDNAQLLVVRLRDGSLLAKRHHNSQHLFLP